MKLNLFQKINTKIFSKINNSNSQKRNDINKMTKSINKYYYNMFLQKYYLNSIFY